MAKFLSLMAFVASTTAWPLPDEKSAPFKGDSDRASVFPSLSVGASASSSTQILGPISAQPQSQQSYPSQHQQQPYQKLTSSLYLPSNAPLEPNYQPPQQSHPSNTRHLQQQVVNPITQQLQPILPNQPASYYPSLQQSINYPNVQPLYSNLQQPYQHLQQPYQNLQQPYQTLQQPYQNLQQPYQTLQQPYQTLQQPYQPYGLSQQLNAYPSQPQQ